MVKKSVIPILLLLHILFFISCEKQREHIAPAIHERDSVPMMTTYGVNQLISDSGVIKYKIVTERWEIYQNETSQKSVFIKGAFLEQFDENFHVQSYIQCDTAYYYTDKQLWELRGRVKILTKDGLDFTSEELFLDRRAHELYSRKYSKLVTPKRTLQGSYFRSDERMTRYLVTNSRGSFEKSDFTGESDTTTVAADSLNTFSRPQASPRPKLPTTP